jgi:hypothetical protein
MYLPLLTTLSGGSSTPIPDEDWPAVVDAALDGDPDAARQLFAAAARWANQLIRQRVWILDPEAEVVALMWDRLHHRPTCSDHWRYLVVRRMRRREYRPTLECPTPPEALDAVGPRCEFEAATVDQLAARAALRGLTPAPPPAMCPFLAAVLTDQPPAPEAAHAARQYRYLRRRQTVA